MLFEQSLTATSPALQSSDGQTFTLPRSAALRWKIIEGLLSETEGSEAIPVAVPAKTLAKCVEFMKFYTDEKPKNDDGKLKTEKEIKVSVIWMSRRSVGFTADCVCRRPRQTVHAWFDVLDADMIATDNI